MAAALHAVYISGDYLPLLPRRRCARLLRRLPRARFFVDARYWARLFLDFISQHIAIVEMPCCRVIVGNFYFQRSISAHTHSFVAAKRIN